MVLKYHLYCYFDYYDSQLIPRYCPWSFISKRKIRYLHLNSNHRLVKILTRVNYQRLNRPFVYFMNYNSVYCFGSSHRICNFCNFSHSLYYVCFFRFSKNLNFVIYLETECLTLYSEVMGKFMIFLIFIILHEFNFIILN